MKLADKVCYPDLVRSYKSYPGSDEAIYCESTGGLTFRERLVISLASNPEITFLGDYTANAGFTDWDEFRKKRDKDVKNIIGLADAIIKRMEKENETK
jgi:hypothetical protein